MNEAEQAALRETADSRDVLIRLENVAKEYRAADGKPVRAIDSVSATVEDGEFITILGPSGCGKSTLLLMVAGLLDATDGTIEFRGKPVEGPPEDFGIVFQDPVLFPWRTVRENVEIAGEIAGVNVSELRSRSQEMVGLVGLAGFENKYPHELSGGMQQRVAIARALLLNPSLLLMDEPFGALDAMTREQMNLELQRIRRDAGATVMLVTHSIAEAAFLADRVFVMSGRPSTVRAVVPIELPRRREISLMASDRFGVYVSRLRSLLDGEGDDHA